MRRRRRARGYTTSRMDWLSAAVEGFFDAVADFLWSWGRR